MEKTFKIFQANATGLSFLFFFGFIFVIVDIMFSISSEYHEQPLGSKVRSQFSIVRLNQINLVGNGKLDGKLCTSNSP